MLKNACLRQATGAGRVAATLLTLDVVLMALPATMRRLDAAPPVTIVRKLRTGNGRRRRVVVLDFAPERGRDLPSLMASALMAAAAFVIMLRPESLSLPPPRLPFSRAAPPATAKNLRRFLPYCFTISILYVRWVLWR